jgi:hypothetical protein
VILALLLACGARTAEPTAPAPAAPVAPAAPAPPAPPAPPQPSFSLETQAVYKALSVRDPEPECAAVEALSATPAQTLLEVVEHASQPPWAGMRAATCLILGHGEAMAPTLASWVQDPDRRGLALLVLDQLDQLPEAQALELAQQALAGPHAADVPSRLARSQRPALHALVPSP